jgi:Kef-type K+ transport system membrane component KefB
MDRPPFHASEVVREPSPLPGTPRLELPVRYTRAVVYRGFVIGLSVLVLVFGLAALISPLARGLGFTTGALLGVALIAVSAVRLYLEFRRARHPTGAERDRTTAP